MTRTIPPLPPAALLVVALLTLATAGFAQEDDIRLWHDDVLELLECQCGCGLTVGSCNHQVCDARDTAKRMARALLSQGADDQTILHVIGHRDVAAARKLGMTDDALLEKLRTHQAFGPAAVILAGQRTWLSVLGVLAAVALVAVLVIAKLRAARAKAGEAAAIAPSTGSAVDNEIERRLREID